MPTIESLPTEEPEREAINGRLLFGVACFGFGVTGLYGRGIWPYGLTGKVQPVNLLPRYRGSYLLF